jgi:hypothetical protein
LISRRDVLEIGLGVFASKSIYGYGFSPDPSVVMKFLDSDTKAFPYRSGKNRWWGFIDEQGNSLIPAETSGITIRLSDFNEGLAAMQFADSSTAMIDTTGRRRFAIYPQYSGWNYTLRDGMLPFRDKNSGKWGYVDKDGLSVFPAQYDLAFPFSERRAVVKVGEWNGIINQQGKWIVPPSLTFALGFQEGFAPVQRDGRWLYLDADGQPAFGRDFEWARAFGDGLAPVRENNSWGAIDRQGRLVVPIRYQDAWASRGGPLMVKRNDLWGFVDATGNEVVQPVYRFCFGFSSGIAAVQDDASGHYRFIRADGSPLLAGVYDQAYSFVLGRAPVRQGRESAWIDETGKAVFRWYES